MISIKAILHQYAQTLGREWQHDRSKTVGASEIGQCARRTWFAKRGTKKDEGFAESWGGQLRGNVIESAFWVPALIKCLPDDVELKFAGDNQQTLSAGYLSATTDGLLVWPNGTAINLDCKTIDPRANLRKEKSEHSFQVQAQMGLIRECTPYKPDSSILSYINASFWDDATEFTIPFSERIYAQAHVRAEKIMTARAALDLPPEGKIAGGGECAHCPWASWCAEIAVAGAPKEDRALGDNAAGMLHEMRNEALALDDAANKYSEQAAQVRERIKQFLRDHNTRWHKGDDWSVSYSIVKGRETIDIIAVEAAGIDLAPYRKTGKPSERLTIR